MQDSYKQQGQRLQMCRNLRAKGITDESVLSVMEKVPRHWFMDSALVEHAYDDQALPILCDQTISQPSTVAFQTQLLGVKPGMKVLEIGTGSGYQTSILCELGAKVFTIERQKGLFDKTKSLLWSLRYTAKCFLGDGYKGLTEVDYAPFDRVIITCGAPYIPQPLMDQLKPDGIMVIPVGNEQQEMLRVTKRQGEEPLIEHFGNCRFVPMLGNVQYKYQ
ncbi:MAG: protein-L-isoaspartate(D-aspartate) O-methyltransferase [Bacteroidales bacterium]|jgi:protein-L-isoaspartate(D-aspartate) O-methyltransferase|nr:protein-L-isoaspartate(D-aspartate) O-methyltransferase [Bacteroidales bacterium]